jgi:DNA-directed RNA polymerase specialized sigma24 family protein
MGAGSNHDMDARHRQYTVKYALNTAEGVGRLLRDMHRLRSARFERGDYAASDILLDLDTAIQRANLTVRQRQAVYYCYEEDMRQVDAAKAMGCAQKNVSEAADRAVEAIAAVYNGWNYGEIEVIYTENNESNENINEGKDDE